ncbi:MAG: universal stress protein [Aphanocapsa sp. GSE-SYN-MK-11-07L]|jgi:nucleotide-binding universal stress UspA family protein|nr:universal stress protein [Aphanocapsa sp. GSE-SYN-MK-11-07L]
MDESETGDRVFEEAISLAKSNRARLMLTHIFLIPGADYPDLSERFSSNLIAIYAEHQDQDKELLEKAKQQCLNRLRLRHRDAGSAGINADVSLLEGDPGRQICNVARKWGADLILIGDRGLTGQDEKIMTTARNYILHHAPCSMHIVQSGKASKQASDSGRVKQAARQLDRQLAFASIARSLP